MAQNSVKTLYFAQLEEARDWGVNYTIQQYSTLNETTLFSSQISNPLAMPATISNGTYPAIKYLAIGNGGYTTNVTGSNSIVFNIPQHRADDAALFNMMPFVMVPANNDLTSIQQAGYRLRTYETFNNVGYFCYYLKLFDTTAPVSSTRVVTLSNGSTTNDVAYVPSSSTLSPSQIDVNNSTVNISSGQHLVTSSVVNITLNTTDIQNIVNAATIRSGDIRTAMISELAVVSGYDTSITSTLGGVSASYTELYYAQVMAFIGELTSLQNSPPSASYQIALSKSFPYPPTTTS